MRLRCALSIFFAAATACAPEAPAVSPTVAVVVIPPVHHGPARFIGHASDAVVAVRDGSLAYVSSSFSDQARAFVSKGDWTAVAAPSFFTRCTIDTKHALKCKEGTDDTPTLLEDVKSVVMDRWGAWVCALGTDGSVVKCLSSEQHVPGFAGATPLMLPAPQGTHFVEIAASNSLPPKNEKVWQLNLFALDDGGTLSAFRLLHGRAPEVRTLGSDFVDVDAVPEYACAVHRTGAVACFAEMESHIPTAPRLDAFGSVGSPPICPVDDAVKVFTGELHYCVLRRDKSVACYGDASADALGRAPRSGCARPEALGGLHDVVDVGVTRRLTCVARENGAVACLGAGGPSPTGIDSFDRGAARLLDKDAEEIAAGSSFVCARTKSDVRCWGLGIADGEVVQGFAGARAIFAGSHLLCAVLPAGELSCARLQPTASFDAAHFGSPVIVDRAGAIAGADVDDIEVTLLDSAGALRYIDIGLGAQPSLAKARALPLRDAVKLGGRVIVRGGNVVDWNGNALATDVRDVDGRWILKNDGELLFSSGGGCNLAMLGVLVPVVGWAIAADKGKCYPLDPPKPIATIANATALAAGDDFACLLRGDGSVVCRTSDDAHLHAIALDRSAQLVAGRTFACSRSIAGAVQCWGSVEHVPFVLGPHGRLRDVSLE